MPPPASPADLAEASDHDLMRLHEAGDPDAFGEIFRRHKDRMWALALRTVSDPELAADCVQDAFIAAFRRSSSFRGDSAVTTWLHRIVINACFDRLRREKARPARGADITAIDIADPHNRHASSEAVMDVREALATLPEQQRAALVLVDMHGLPIAEAAAILEVPEGTVKSRCARGRAALAAILRIDDE